MNAFANYFISGNPIFPGCAMIMMGVVFSFFYNKKMLYKILSRVFFLTGIVLIVVSATSISNFTFSIMIIAIFSLYFTLSMTSKTTAPFINLCRALAFIGAAYIFYQEYAIRNLSVINPSKFEKLFIIGDTLTGKGDTNKNSSWYNIVKNESNLPVVNLCTFENTIFSSFERADLVYGNNIMVIVDGGRNDVMSGLPLKVFSEHLEALLKVLVKSGRLIIMFEIPVSPLNITYSKLQRDLCEKYHVRLLPKYIISSLLHDSESSPDGIYLNENGQRKIADEILKITGVKKSEHTGP